MSELDNLIIGFGWITFIALLCIAAGSTVQQTPASYRLSLWGEEIGYVEAVDLRIEKTH